MKIVKYDKFLETKLNIGLLNTKRVDGVDRGDILVNKLNTDHELTLNNGQSIEVTNSDDIVDKITDDTGEFNIGNAVDVLTSNNNGQRPRYDNVFDTDKGRFKLNDFKKDVDFGSSGAGRNTRDFENLQCVFLAHKLSRPNIILNEVNIINFLREYSRNVNLIQNVLELKIPNPTETVREPLTKLLLDPNWNETLISVTNDLYNFKSRGISLFNKNYNGKYKVYHISYNGTESPFKIIDNKFSKLQKTENRINFAKYCPADVIVYKGDLDLHKVLENIKSIEGLTYTLNALFSSRVLIPISLKKVGKEVIKDNVPIKSYDIIINNEFRRSLPEFEIESFSIYGDINRGIGSKIKVKSTWTDAKGKVINGEPRIITIDSANTSKSLNVDGEVEGKFSRHGKISFVYMKYFIELVSSDIKLRKPVLQVYSELKDMSDEQLIHNINYIINKLNSKRNIKLNVLNTGNTIDNNRTNKLISKLQSLQIILALANINSYSKKKSNNVINDIMRYALSIKAVDIVTPRYVRVI